MPSLSGSACPRPVRRRWHCCPNIVARHTATIPFENLDILLGRPSLRDIGSIQAKLVDARRGGYCFEQNTLLRAVLERLGFTVESLMARAALPQDFVQPDGDEPVGRRPGAARGNRIRVGQHPAG